ncbi:MAG: hypothetical protein A2896_01815 [Candidatus Nealsonbacteria bacterium RIFCSPLOWO2_01_FULL_43_32]|uniref:Peptidase S11 D-alanyl-D-alanine carboxypeptidase A N-terminal domain-containing protein n=1 Tax=Candidatus Nealsonbacteria bacterium RIFCSPLOWO2_01_FULL_43_32 TaxID=1801672 RepID=A0A1G2EH15_9BACT|nr:MAG: hypothetical protein A2896_01815 [Candidatus Nealsonbacteria bacterium RIFCSPLOWO2_01_FULL_43_32]
MARNLKYFLISLVLSLPFWWGIKSFSANLDDFFYYRELTVNPKILTARANQLAFEENLKNLKPIRQAQVPSLTLNAKSAISLLVDDQGEGRILFNRTVNEPLPIASLTKLMTALVVLKKYDLAKEIKISKEAVSMEENLGKLNVGEMLSVEYLLYPLLMESSNDAAFALANDYDGMNAEAFVELMNAEAQKLGLKNTHFVNVTGLDPENLAEINYASAYDLTMLAQELLKSPLIRQIFSTAKINLYGPELINSNGFLGRIPGVIGGKTGYTERALGCFLLIFEAPKANQYLINVILGADDRSVEMEKLINWLNEAYKW